MQAVNSSAAFSVIQKLQISLVIVCLIVSLQSQGETYLAFAWSFLDIFVFDLHGYMGVIVMLTVNDTFKWTLSAKERLTHHIAFFHAQDL